MEYPAKMIVRSKELWLNAGSAKPLSFEKVAATVNGEFGTKVTRKTIHEWCTQFGWTRADVPETSVATVAPLVVSSTPLGNMMDAEAMNDWDWEKKKAVFLTELTGLAEGCIAAVRDQVGKGQLAFRDAESAAKTALACLDTVGKINSGKFDKPEDGDKLPTLREGDVVTVVQYFLTKGRSAKPNLREGSIDAPSEVIP